MTEHVSNPDELTVKAASTLNDRLGVVRLDLPAVERIRLIVAAKGTAAENENRPTNEQLAILELADVLNALTLKDC